VPIDTLSANRYARTPASFVHRMGASTHDLCSPGRDTRAQTPRHYRDKTPTGHGG
jgi:hypothetical protein